MLALANAGVQTWVDYEPHIAHKKVIEIDGSTVLTGSFNWTTSADLHNAENLLILRDSALSALHTANVESRLRASQGLSDYLTSHNQR